MISFIRSLFILVLLAAGIPAASIFAQSVYTQKPEDPNALYFTPEEFAIQADGKSDVSDSLQSAIYRLKREKNYGILFIPQGKYLISKTIYVPKAIRLIGYGENRPEFILAKSAPGFDEEIKYMLWFTDRIVEEGQRPRDAGAGTFYSAVSNIDFRIGKGNPMAVALRTHFAQHGFVSHCNFHLKGAYAGIHELGNEIEDLKFFGGEYGIVSGRTSPGWPMMLLDLYFKGQEKAAILSRNTGMAIVGMHVKDVPVGVELQEDVPDRLFMEDCLLEDVSRGVVIGAGELATNQVNLKNVACRKVPVAVHFAKSGQQVPGEAEEYMIRQFSFGLLMESMADASHYGMRSDLEAVSGLPDKPEKTIPALPTMESWVNIRDLGAKGDGVSDDTEVLKKALAAHRHIYFPSGWYRITQSLKMEPGTKLIGLHPWSTQLVLEESTPAFSGFGAPVPMLESSEGGDDVLNGIGLRTGGYNYRAVGLKWMAGEQSLVNDVKFVGGHGTMYGPGERPEWRRRNRAVSSPAAPVYGRGPDQAWDNQYWSLWVTNGGGGILKDIWTANTYASTGLYISNTSTPGRVFAMSLEHHLRQECRLDDVANWKFYAFQFEEEGLEGKECISMEMNRCRNLEFANLWMYRTIRVNTPRHWGIRVSDCENIRFRNMRSWTQILQLPERSIYDMDKNLSVFPGDFALARITGQEPSRRTAPFETGAPEQLGSGFEFATGAVSDSRGNVYFCDHHQKRIYRWSVLSETVTVYADYPYKPFSLAVDTEDNLLVICRYDPQPGFLVNGEQEGVERLADDNPMYSGWGNSGWATLAYAIDPDLPDDMQVLDRIKTEAYQRLKRVIHPTHRWRDDFEEVAGALADTSFLGPDGLTLIPQSYDLGRSVQLMAVTPGQEGPVYVSHEDPKITYSFQVDQTGRLTDMREFIRRGEYSNLTNEEGIVYLAEGQILVLDASGEEISRITLDERVQSMALGGKEKDQLFITTSTSFYRMRLK